MLRKKFLASLVSIILLAGCASFSREDEVHINFSTNDSREVESRSASINGMLFSVSSFSLYNLEYQGVKSKGRGFFFIVDYIVTNNSVITRTFDPSSFSIVMTSGGAYELSKYSDSEFDEKNKAMTNIPPGESITGEIVFDLPASAKPDTLLVVDSNPDNAEVIDIPMPKE